MIDRPLSFPDNVMAMRIFPGNYKTTASLLTLMGFLGVFSLCYADQVIAISGQAFTLIDTNRLTKKSAVKKAKAGADSAIAAVAAAAKKAEDEGVALQARLDSFGKSVEAYREKMAVYDRGMMACLGEVNRHNQDVARYTQQLNAHNQRVEALNALKPEEREAATINALSAEAESLSNWVVKLKNETLALDAKTNELLELQAKADLLVKPLLAEGRLLGPDVKTNLTMLSETCQQFQLSYDYAQQINPFLEKYHVKPTPQDDARMNDYAKVLDRIKALKTAIQSNASSLNLDL